MELNCRLRITGIGFAKIQVGTYNGFVEIPAHGAKWIQVEVRQRGEQLSITADGVTLKNALGIATVATPGSLTSSVTFSAAGAYTFLLMAANSTHTPAYDAVVITVQSGGGGGGSGSSSGGGSSGGGGCGVGALSTLIILGAGFYLSGRMTCER